MRFSGKLALIAAWVASAACTIPDAPLSSTAAAVSAPLYPLALGPAGSRYLVDQTGAPFLWSGDAAWSLIAQLSIADVNTYLDDRKAKGFDVIMVNLIEHQFATNAPANIAGDAPFPGRAFVAPNEAYFAHADDVVRAAAARGITVLLAPLYLGYGCDAEGWCAEVGAATTAELTAWGQYVGARYGAFDNIVWLIGGDMDPTSLQAHVLAVVNGILATDARHLMTAHNDQTSARSRWPNQPWLAIDNVYSYDPALASVDRAEYSTQPVMPYFLIESNYENEHAVTVAQLRAQAYWTMLSGGTGQVFGNCPIWHMGSSTIWCGTVDWQGNLGATGSLDVMRFNHLFASRPWHLLVPDLTSSVLTSGAGSGSSLATCARASDGSTVIAYLPTARTVAIDLTKLSGAQANAWWFSPSTGIATAIGTFTTTGIQTFTPSAGDWVLVVDDASRAFSTPGAGAVSAPPTIASAATASPSETTGTTIVQVLGDDDGGESSLIYRWSAAGPGTVSFTPNSSNAAKSSVATFTAAGPYTLTATVSDADGQAVTSSVAVIVDAVPTAITVSPAQVTLPTSSTLTFNAVARDQFGGALAAQPAFTWSSTGGTVSPIGLFTAGTTAGAFTVTATTGTSSGVAQVTITNAPPPPPDTIVDFESLSNNAVLSSYGGITWGSNWRVWAGGSVYTKNAFVNSTAKTEVTSTFTLPANTVLKSLRIAVGSGGTAASIKISSPGNVEQVYTDINGTYKTKTLGWTTAAQVITVKIICTTGDGASDLAFDTIRYGGIGGAPPNQAPTIATAAAASPSPVTTTTSALSVLGADDAGEPALAYTWAATAVPSGGAATFSVNGTNAAKSTTATFTKAGTYTLTATARDAAGLTATSNVNVIVQATPTTLTVTPASATVATGATQTFTATVRDQFAATLASTIAWSVAGGGTISNAGVFTATTAGGPFTVTATAGALVRTATVTVTSLNAAPTIATAAAASSSPVTGTTAALSVLGADDAGESALIYTWAATTVPAGGAAAFSANGTNASKAAIATFTKAGTYVLTATVRDTGGLQVTSSATVVVQATPTSITVAPATATIANGATQTFTATVRDQFAATLAASLSWSVTGGGTISSTGVFTATTTGGPYTVTATAGALSGTATVTVSSVSNTVVDFETLSDNAVLSSYGGITWGSSWRVWAGGSVYTKNAFINSTAKTEVTSTFTLPAGTVLKSLRIAVGSGGSATSVKISSPGNVEQFYTDINGTYKTKTLGWTTAAQVITVKIICPTGDGASDLAFDTITYGP